MCIIFSVRRVVHITYEKIVEERKKKKVNSKKRNSICGLRGSTDALPRPRLIGPRHRSLGATGCQIGFAIEQPGRGHFQVLVLLMVNPKWV
jgi:hypothetical protein